MVLVGLGRIIIRVEVGTGVLVGRGVAVAAMRVLVGEVETAVGEPIWVCAGVGVV